jgi:hypothetical protein
MASRESYKFNNRFEKYINRVERELNKKRKKIIFFSPEKDLNWVLLLSLTILVE